MPERIRKAETGRVLRAMMCAFAVAFVIGALVAPDRADMLNGLVRLCAAPAQLTKDWFLPGMGGVSASMLNAAIVSAMLCALTFLPGAEVNGTTVLGFFLTVGFCSWGMSPVNVLPMLLGTFVYARIKKLPLGQCVNAAMFATGLSPLVTQALFYYPVAGSAPRFSLLGLVLALAIGVVVGCAMPALCIHSKAFHKGFDLYNAGPAAGFLCFLIYVLLYKVIGVDAPPIEAVLGEGQQAFANLFCAAVFILCVACGVLLNGGFSGYGRLLRDPGLGSDFTKKYGAGLCLVNLGVYGLFILLYYNLIGATFTGVTMGVVFCMVCCGCNGATPLNVLPVMIGYGIMGLLYRAGVTAFAINAQAIVVGLCYASGLAPISGVYGPVAGIAAAMLHYCLVTSVPPIHGGYNLYNGGFTAGIVCFLLVPVLEHFFGPGRGREER